MRCLSLRSREADWYVYLDQVAFRSHSSVNWDLHQGTEEGHFLFPLSHEMFSYVHQLLWRHCMCLEIIVGLHYRGCLEGRQDDLGYIILKWPISLVFSMEWSRN